MAAHTDGNVGALNDRPVRDQIRALQSQLTGVKAQLEEVGKRIV